MYMKPGIILENPVSPHVRVQNTHTAAAHPPTGTASRGNSTTSRGTQCHVKQVNCSLWKKHTSQTLMLTHVGEDVIPNPNANFSVTPTLTLSFEPTHTYSLGLFYLINCCPITPPVFQHSF